MQIVQRRNKILLKIHSHIRDYDVVFEKDFSFLHKYIIEDKRIFLIDENVYKKYKRTLFKELSTHDVIVVNAVEDGKNLDVVMSIYDRLLTLSIKRKLRLISIGGGITQDIAGFVCSTLYRGIELICVPTTLLSQVDSCIGSKTSLNYKTYKNILGTFYPPSKIHIQQLFLQSLKDNDIYCGLGEIVKLQLMSMHSQNDINKIRKGIRTVKKFISHRNVDVSRFLRTSLQIKQRYIEKDEFDLGVRNLLNFGHEFGHALESASFFNIPHGIGVTVGIIFANSIAQKRGLLSLTLSQRILKNLLIPCIPSSFLKKQYFNEQRLLEGMKKDKKRESNDLVVVVLKNNFKLEKLVNVSIEEFQYAVQTVTKYLFPPKERKKI